MVQQLAVYFTYIIEQLGYWGAGLLMMLESMVAPVPSELVMPFVGFLVAEGKFTIPMSIFAASVGSIVGSVLSYYMGDLGGRPFVLKVGRYLLLNREDLEWTERWFERHGSWTIFVSRFIPVVRHLISIAAGLGKMRIVPFCIYTLIGATMWNTFLLVCGYHLRRNWTLVQKYSHELDLIVAAGLVLVGIWFVVVHLRRAKRPGPLAARAATGVEVQG